MYQNDRPIETLIPERDATPRQNRISSPGQGNSFPLAWTGCVPARCCSTKRHRNI